MWHSHCRIRTRLTARTLKSDVLPAFCSPIIVISISVALDSDNNQHSSQLIGEHKVAFSWTGAGAEGAWKGASGTKAGAYDIMRGAQEAYQNRRSSQS